MDIWEQNMVKKRNILSSDKNISAPKDFKIRKSQHILNDIHDEMIVQNGYIPNSNHIIQADSLSKTQTKSQILSRLRSIQLSLHQTKNEVAPPFDTTQENGSHISVFDMDGVQFATRKNKKIYSLIPIRTRLEWQSGEYPVFRTSARYYTAEAKKFKERRRIMRRMRFLSIINPVNNEYNILPQPEHDWPVSGQFYITNLQILFRVNKNEFLTIPFYLISQINFYYNAVEVIYYQKNLQKTDIFYINDDTIRLAEVILQALG